MGEDSYLAKEVKSQLKWPLFMIIILAGANIPVYFFSVYGGVIISCATGVYALVAVLLYRHSKVNVADQ